jgi:hypothetical protein
LREERIKTTITAAGNEQTILESNMIITANTVPDQQNEQHHQNVEDIEKNLDVSNQINEYNSIVDEVDIIAHIDTSV